MRIGICIYTYTFTPSRTRALLTQVKDCFADGNEPLGTYVSSLQEKNTRVYYELAHGADPGAMSWRMVRIQVL